MKKIILTLFIFVTSFLVINAQVTPNVVNLTAYVDQTVSCYGNNDGRIEATAYPTLPVVGGSNVYYGNTYTYTLTNILTLETYTSVQMGVFTHLPPGLYSVQAADSMNNVSNVVSGLMVTQPAPLAVEWIVEQYPSTYTSYDGILTANITGGTADIQPYLTWWTEGWTGDTINNVYTNNFAVTLDSLNQQVYQISIEDDNGCFLISEFWFLNE